MDKSRLIRFTYPGILFLFSILAMNWILGGNLFETFIGYLQAKFGDKYVLIFSAIISAIISSPILGFVLTSFSYEWILRKCIGLFVVPRELKSEYDTAISRLSGINLIDVRNFGPERRLSIHQSILRSRMAGEPLRFTERRYGFGLLHLNSAFSMLLGVSIAGVIFLYTLICSGVSRECYSEILIVKIITFIVLLVYSAYGFRFAKNGIRESNNFEIDWIIIKANEIAPQ